MFAFSRASPPNFDSSLSGAGQRPRLAPGGTRRGSSYPRLTCFGRRFHRSRGCTMLPFTLVLPLFLSVLLALPVVATAANDCKGESAIGATCMANCPPGKIPNCRGGLVIARCTCDSAPVASTVAVHGFVSIDTVIRVEVYNASFPDTAPAPPNLQHFVVLPVNVNMGSVPMSVEKARGASSDEIDLPIGFVRCPHRHDLEVA